MSKPVALVTGASRGAGRGIAVALGSHGCTVYVTGRSEKAGDANLPGTIGETAQAITDAGGRGIAVRVDHRDDRQVEALFEQIEREQGRLDILVNNACFLHDRLTEPGHFWEKPAEIVDMLDIGLRSSFIASYHGAPLLTRQLKGLIVFTSASGSVHYVFGPVYGAHKAGMDKFAADMAVDLKAFNVASVSIWMGALQTERLEMIMASAPEKFEHVRNSTETPEFTGHVIWALFNDPALMEMSGKTLIGAELGAKYGILDRDGRRPTSYRDTHKVSPHEQYPLIVR